MIFGFNFFNTSHTAMRMIALCVLMSCLSICLGYGSDCSTFIKGPLTVEQSVGKWSLMAMAHENNMTIISDVGLEHAFMEVYLKDRVPHLTHLSIRAGRARRFEIEDLAVKDGYLTYTSERFGSKPAFRSISDDCALYSFQNPADIHFFYCRSNRPSIDDFRKIIKYSNCHNYQHIVIRRDSEPSCIDIPHEIKDFDLEKLEGKWKMVAGASVVLKHDIDISTEIHFMVDGDRVTVSLGEGKNVITGRKSMYRFNYGIPRTGHLQDKEIVKFKNFASCMSARVVFVNE
ncbi:uncharacterized protein LOC143983352 isoform X2 [Lithobates pipiens]